VSLNPLSDLTADELWNTQLMLNLICGRNKAVLPKRRRKYLCSLAGLLVQEAQNRDLTFPTPPYSVGHARPDKL
jgi:hypothetical protein